MKKNETRYEGIGIVTRGAKYWNSVAAEWQRGNSYTLWRKHCDRTTADLLRSKFPPNRAGFLLKTDLFDEANGEGLLSLLKNRARTVVGMDIAFKAAELACIKYPDINPLNADARTLPIRDESFDMIVSNSTVDHFPESTCILDSLREFFRVLRPGGILLLTMDNLMNPFVAVRQLITFPVLHRLGIVPYYFGRTFGPRQLKTALKDCGFTFGRIMAFMHSPRIPAVALSRVLARYGSANMQKRFLRLLLFPERITFHPICLVTGHFLVVRAVKP